MTDLAPIRFWLESLIRPIIREVLTDELMDIHPSPPQPNTGNRYLNAAEAAAFMGIKLQTLYQNIDKVPHIKQFGKLAFLEVDLVAHMEKGRTHAKI